MPDTLPPTIRRRLEKVIMSVPGPVLKEFCKWLEEVEAGGIDRGFDAFTFKAFRGDIKGPERTTK